MLKVLTMQTIYGFPDKDKACKTKNVACLSVLQVSGHKPMQSLKGMKESKWKLLSYVRLFVAPWTIQSMKFSRPEYWYG